MLIISGDTQDRETTRLLLASMGCRWILASTLEEALRALSREPVAAAVLDSGVASWDRDGKNESLRDIVKHLAGRVILVLREARDPRAAEFARAYGLPFLKRDRWAQELWRSIEALLQQSVPFRSAKEAARLVVDTFLQALPAGVRYARPSIRHLLYESSLLAVDVSFELLPDSKSIALAGQILSNVQPHRPRNAARVRVLGAKGLLGVTMTNESGEFLFEFEKEPRVVLEIEDGPSHQVAIHSPNLSGWAERRRPQRAETTAKKSQRRKLALAT